MKNQYWLCPVLLAGLLLIQIPAAVAHSGITVQVEVIKALQNSTEVDPELTGLADEVGSVLNFQGFRLLKKSRIPLKAGESGEVLLSDERRLTLHLAGFEDDQARLTLKIFKDQAEIFSTTLMMVDDGSAIIGGPRLKKGVMLLRIKGQFY